MKKIITAIFLTMAALSLHAQQSVTVKGSVKDSAGEPLIGAAVLVDGTSNGALTDIDGNYTITFTMPRNGEARLVFSCISYKTVTEEVGGRGVIDVILADDLEQLDEVVVVGYGSMKKSDITGSVTSVEIDEMNAAQSASLDQLLQGRAAGVQVVSTSAAPDAASSITIRGASSFNSNSQPLYVVDGVILNVSTEATVGSHAGSDNGIDQDTNGLMGINPQDIASIEILKDASATAIYGSEGANGVILITTKTASQEKPMINFTAGLSISNIYKKFDLLDAEGYKYYLKQKGVSESSSYYTTFTDGIASGEYVEQDWQDYTTRTAITQRYYLTISGRPHKTNYLFSMGYHGNSGIVKGTGYQNPTLRLNLDRSVGKFSFGTKTSLSFLHSEMTQGVGSTISQNPSSSLITSMLRSRPARKLSGYDEDGTELMDEDAPMAGPDRWLSDFRSYRTEFRITPSLYAEYKILPWLSIKSTFGMDYRTNEQSKFKSRRINMQATGSTGAVTHIDRMNWNWDNVITADKWFKKKQHLVATLGQSASSRSTKVQTVEGTNITQWRAMVNSLNSANSNFFVYSENYSQLLSFFARVMYGYNERYILTATYRIDGSSKFAKGHRWAQFPSFAFAWRISNEPWFKVNAISSAKLRIGWGLVGNQGIPSYQTMNRYNTATTATHDNSTHQLITLYSLNLPNRDLKWETTSQFNGGIDLGFFKGRLTFSLDGYYKLTKDLLQTKTVAGSMGVNNPYVNMGSILNKGFELTLSGVPVATKLVELKLGGNFTLNRNKIVSIDPSGAARGTMCLYRGDKNTYDVDYFTGVNLSGDAICKDYINIFIAGQPMCLFYAMPTDGIVQEGQTGVPFEDGKVRGPGSINFLDTNQDGKISAADRVIVGDPNPDFIYGFNVSLRVQNFTLNADFTGSYGNDVYNQQNAILGDMSNNFYNVLRACVYDTWSPERPDAKYPAISQVTTGDANWCTDRYVEDGSYLRLSNLALSYYFAFKNKKSVLKRLTLGVSGKNLFCASNYSGYDPDVNSYGTVLKYGVDNGSYPAARTYLFDIKLTF